MKACAAFKYNNNKTRFFNINGNNPERIQAIADRYGSRFYVKQYQIIYNKHYHNAPFLRYNKKQGLYLKEV